MLECLPLVGETEWKVNSIHIADFIFFLVSLSLYSFLLGDKNIVEKLGPTATLLTAFLTSISPTHKIFSSWSTAFEEGFSGTHTLQLGRHHSIVK